MGIRCRQKTQRYPTQEYTSPSDKKVDVASLPNLVAHQSSSGDPTVPTQKAQAKPYAKKAAEMRCPIQVEMCSSWRALCRALRGRISVSSTKTRGCSVVSCAGTLRRFEALFGEPVCCDVPPLNALIVPQPTSPFPFHAKLTRTSHSSPHKTSAPLPPCPAPP